MNQQQRNTLVILLVVGLLYFLAFIPPNLTGAQDADMISVFEADEFAQYPNVIRMLTPGDTPYQSLRNFTVYQHYFYGYPFYFFSALSVLPIRLLYGANWTDQTPLIMMSLRQLMNIMPLLIAALLLVYIQTRFKPRWKAIALFILMLSLPAVVSNNSFWHPDSLSILFVVLTIFLLDLDSLSFKKFFFLAAAACGVAVGIKHHGLFFFIAILLYILWGILSHKITWRRGVLVALMFVLLMAATVVITNPLLLLPIERGEIIRVQLNDLQQLNVGHLMRTTTPYFQWGSYPEDFRIHYGELFFILLCLVALVVAIIRPHKRLVNTIILAFIIPLAYTLNYTGTRRTHYFLPVVLPMVSALVHIIPDKFVFRTPFARLARPSIRNWLKWLLPLIACALIIAQFVIFVRTDITLYRAVLTREQDSASLDFARKIDDLFLSRSTLCRTLVIYRDWHMYVYPAPSRLVEMSWDLATYDLIYDMNPDLILLEQANIDLFGSPSAVEEASDPDAMAAWHKFYSDADINQVPGYLVLYRDKFGVALVKEALFKATCTDTP